MALLLRTPPCEPAPPPLFLLRRNHTPPPLLPRRPPPPVHLRRPALRLRAPARRPTARASGLEDTAELLASAESASPEDLECVSQIKSVLERLKRNRDMLPEEVKLTLMIEDPREAERKRLLGIEDDEVSRDDLVDALEDVNQGKVPQNRVALKLLAEEMSQWPNLEVEVPKKKKSSSSYASVTDTGIDPSVAAKRLNMAWDADTRIDPNVASKSLNIAWDADTRIDQNVAAKPLNIAFDAAAEMESESQSFESVVPAVVVETLKKTSSSYTSVPNTKINPNISAKRLDIEWDAAAEVESPKDSSAKEVPPIVGYGALYFVSALPVLIGISVVLILFYNSLQ